MVLTFREDGTKLRFDSDGSVVRSISDRNGSTIRLDALGVNGQTARVRDTQGRALSFAFSADSSRLVSATDASGRKLAYAYTQTADGRYDLTKVTDPAGQNTLYGYDADHPLVKITTPGGSVTKLAYDGANRATALTRVTDTAAGTGPTTRFAYSAGKTVVTDPRGHELTYSYDGLDRVTRVVDQRGNTQGHVVDERVQRGLAYRRARRDHLQYLRCARAAHGLGEAQVGGDDRGRALQLELHGHGRVDVLSDDLYGSQPGLLTALRLRRGGESLECGHLRMDPAGGESSLGSQVALDYNTNGTVKSVKDPLYTDSAPNAHITRFSYDAKTAQICSQQRDVRGCARGAVDAGNRTATVLCAYVGTRNAAGRFITRIIPVGNSATAACAVFGAYKAVRVAING
jgi:YD repeat-containing protein